MVSFLVKTMAIFDCIRNILTLTETKNAISLKNIQKHGVNFFVIVLSFHMIPPSRRNRQLLVAGEWFFVKQFAGF
jgi:hypothetical protein